MPSKEKKYAAVVHRTRAWFALHNAPSLRDLPQAVEQRQGQEGKGAVAIEEQGKELLEHPESARCCPDTG
jgi:hypothetical protein